MTKLPVKKVTAPAVKRSLPPLGRYPVFNKANAPTRMAGVVWGPAGAGKTTWLGTAPGEKLWLSFGDNEHVSVMHRDDVNIVNLSDLHYDELFKETSNDNPFGLDKYLAENEEIETLVCDSLTAIEYKGLQRAVANGVGASLRFKPTMEAPGMSAYGGRNANVIEAMTGLLRVTAKHNVHIFFTAHEADPTLTKEGNIDYIAIALGGKIINQTTWRLSEIWNFRQLQTGDREREVTVRTHGQRKPMKTRMFDTKGKPNFVVNYDPDKPDNAPGQVTIAGFYQQWLEAGMTRIPVPTNTKGPSK